MKNKFNIHKDISLAETLPASFYKDDIVFQEVKEKVFLRSWQWIGDKNLVKLPKSVYPFVLLDGYLTEPMLLTRDTDDQINCLTNVCTHRGNLVVLGAGISKKLTCLYHGKRFNLNGGFEYMPEFGDAQDFPRACENLHQF
ncbi:MAG: Rieske 2Fe-2S domain-containing protein, partial [Flavobacteriaceae bacterium]|nr:Rieske 2Fe-2S domain-containing protein [Flavobacteriaceae bacterium]